MYQKGPVNYQLSMAIQTRERPSYIYNQIEIRKMTGRKTQFELKAMFNMSDL